MQRLVAFFPKLWESLQRSELVIDSGLTHAPLLSGPQIADLRQRALSAIAYQKTNKPVLHRQHGEHVSPRRGRGLDYDESRLYQTGDEIRFMNWRLTARSGEPHVKVFREERRPSAFILLDWRAGMRFGTQVRLKAEQALRAAVLLIFYNHYCGRSLSGLVINAGLQWLETCHDEQAILGMVSGMNQPCPPLPINHPQVNFIDVLRAIQTTSTPGTQVYLISDFNDVTSDCQSILAQLAAEQNVNAIHIVDPAEQQLPRAGKLPLSGTSDDSVRQVDTSNLQVATQFRRAAQQYLTERESLLRGLGISYVRLLTTVECIETDLVFT
jgi:uncharacterized protein (DUF58 family)